jgi:aldose 1-epimerase
VITLQCGNARALVAPDYGGAIAGWTIGPRRLFRMPLPAAVLLGDVHGMACFPLLPYANRIGNGQFVWQESRYDVRRNLPGHPHSLHGVGWQRPWQVAHLSDTDIELHLAFKPRPSTTDDWPFAFDATQQIALAEDGLRIGLRLTNRHGGPAPAGIGVHPYFPRGRAATLTFHADGVWQNDPTLLPRVHRALPQDWNHAAGRPVGSVVLDNCFTNWPCHASIAWDGYGVAIEADPVFSHLQVYTPRGEDFFCVEPVSHRPDAINDRTGGEPEHREADAAAAAARTASRGLAPDERADTVSTCSMTILQAGDSLEGSVLFRAT